MAIWRGSAAAPGTALGPAAAGLVGGLLGAAAALLAELRHGGLCVPGLPGAGRRV